MQQLKKLSQQELKKLKLHYVCRINLINESITDLDTTAMAMWQELNGVNKLKEAVKKIDKLIIEK